MLVERHLSRGRSEQVGGQRPGGSWHRAAAGGVDGIPIIDRLPGAANLLVGTSWSGHGFALALAMAQLLADWATGSERPALLRPFAYDRFLA